MYSEGRNFIMGMELEIQREFLQVQEGRKSFQKNLKTLLMIIHGTELARTDLELVSFLESSAIPL